MDPGISYIEVVQFLSGHFPNAKAEPRDSKYLLLDPLWFATEFPRSFDSYCLREGLKVINAYGQPEWVYVSNEFDCEDAADEAVCHMKRLHRKTAGRPSGYSIPFGTIWYVTRDPQGNKGSHEANIAILRNKSSGLYIVGFEPQTSTQFQLTDEERLSCSEARF